jgi:predicted Zn-dependent protease
VVNDPTINAYSASGGFVYLNTGLLDFLESEDELAVIMAHEIGHIVDRHQVKFQQSVHDKKVMGVMGGAMLGAALGVAGAQALGSAPPPSSSAYAMHQQATSQMLGLGLDAGMALGNLTAVSMIKGYGKKLELRADSLAIQYAHASNYDPNALVDVFNRLASIRDRLRLNENNYVSNLINAEPGLEERIEEAERLISEAG